MLERQAFEKKAMQEKSLRLQKEEEINVMR